MPPPPPVSHTGTLWRRAEVVLFGRDHGHLDEYGHFDLILGRRARTEVWPHIVDALRGEDSKKGL